MGNARPASPAFAGASGAAAMPSDFSASTAPLSSASVVVPHESLSEPLDFDFAAAGAATTSIAQTTSRAVLVRRNIRDLQVVGAGGTADGGRRDGSRERPRADYAPHLRS